MAAVLKAVKSLYLRSGSIFAKFCTMVHIDPFNPTRSNEMLFAGQTRVRRKNHVLIAGAHWRLVANTIEPSMRGGHQRRAVQNG